MRNRNLKLSEKVNNQLKSSSFTASQIEELSFDSANSNIVIKSENLLCVKSMGNYVTLFFLEESQLKKKIIRSTMKGIEKNISESHKIIRCHKSYFVNINKVITTSGNARALYLHINQLNFQIPVSRNFSKKIILGTL
ncbi:MAG: LytTR family transcriptional regulator [Melioribacteraceae bacterium]|nr:LytTR family transcriptional regulator [Melioribacteraceae bacterium]